MIIETNRCRIRPFEDRDIDAFMIYRNNDEWMKYQSFKNLTRQQYASFLLGAQNMALGMQLVVADKITDKLIGDIYIKYDNETYWLGYSINPDYSGKGYMTESVKAFINWLEQTDPADIFAGVLPDNSASIRLLERLGFEYLRFDPGDGEVVYVLKA